MSIRDTQTAGGQQICMGLPLGCGDPNPTGLVSRDVSERVLDVNRMGNVCFGATGHDLTANGADITIAPNAIHHALQLDHFS